MPQLIVLADLIKPLLNGIQIVIMLALSVIALYSLTKRRNLTLALFTAGALLGVLITGFWFVFSLQAYWNIGLVSQEIRQAGYLFVQVAYPIEIALWACAFVLLIKQNFRSV